MARLAAGILLVIAMCAALPVSAARRVALLIDQQPASAGKADPTQDGRVKQLWRGILRSKGESQHGKKPLLIGDLRKILKLARLQQLHAPGRLDQSLSEHMALFAALKARDPDGAEAAMRTHLNRQRTALRELARRERTKMIAP